MPEDPPAPGARRRVLLVEDEAMIAMLVEDMLADLGRELVTVASRLDEALAAARTATVDVAILELNLGGCSATRWPTFSRGGASRSSSRPVTAAAASTRSTPIDQRCPSRSSRKRCVMRSRWPAERKPGGTRRRARLRTRAMLPACGFASGLQEFRRSRASLLLNLTRRADGSPITPCRSSCVKDRETVSMVNPR
jgi:CheY-like chemotaxis protein